MHLETESLSVLQQALSTMEQGFADLPEFKVSVDRARLTEVLQEAAVAKI